MSELANRLEGLLQRPVLTAEDAERAGQTAEALAELLRAQEKAKRVLTATTERKTPVPETRSLAGKTLQDAAEAVLRESGTPLHARELGRRIKQRGWVHPRGKPSRPDQIVYQLAARLPKHPRRFKRVAPNTFALTDQAGGTATPRRPRLGLFKGIGGNVAREIGDSTEAAAGGSDWRSS